MRFLILLLPFFLFAKEVCLDFSEIDTDDPYVKQAIIRKVEEYVLEAGFKVKCTENTLRIKVRANYREVPSTISARQRVSSYTLYLSVSLGEESFSASVPYSLPSGSLAELPRRKALEEAFSRIKLHIIKYFSREYLREK
ncbi:hypothetical protein [Aquifex aeolicus]|uniref:Uncharacterized protein aq_252 n=1 Tax=Aquifex aeolicus (strain VF5) TaxID=224324 RepID=Y252_AQUAE|nr:hypothetical protein [Aquifex aeolicus]O66613.1 RecName: Full=Uncharacterized protein aq_252 [Aquifex aeolicus VF5]AAC06573.1 putative protein [Aquifex aeolicus VF5]